jgi:hypothetical protein
MTEEQAHTNAKALALGMGITFYVVRSREGGFCRCNCHRMTAKSWHRSHHPEACTIKGWREPGYYSHPGQALIASSVRHIGKLTTENSALGLDELRARRSVTRPASG